MIAEKQREGSSSCSVPDTHFSQISSRCFSRHHCRLGVVPSISQAKTPRFREVKFSTTTWVHVCLKQSILSPFMPLTLTLAQEDGHSKNRSCGGNVSVYVSTGPERQFSGCMLKSPVRGFTLLTCKRALRADFSTFRITWWFVQTDFWALPPEFLIL